jgi:hypothetical protein
MSDFPQDADPKSWHRCFAIRFNNRAWDLAEQDSRTPEETREMLDAAHAAAAHWDVVGTPLNRMRARTLVAHACALAGFGEFALHIAEEVRSYFLSQETPDWELALVHSIHANTAAIAGEIAKHKDSYEAARVALMGISDAKEREIVMQTFRLVPLPTRAPTSR